MEAGAGWRERLVADQLEEGGQVGKHGATGAITLPVNGQGGRMTRTYINEGPGGPRPDIVPTPQKQRGGVVLRVEVRSTGESKTYTFDTPAEADAFKRGVLAGATMVACIIAQGRGDDGKGD